MVALKGSELHQIDILLAMMHDYELISVGLLGTRTFLPFEHRPVSISLVGNHATTTIAVIGTTVKETKEKILHANCLIMFLLVMDGKVLDAWGASVNGGGGIQLLELTKS